MNVVQMLLVAALAWIVAPVEKTALTEADCKVYFPNAFSPNNDGINDEFKPTIANDCTFTSFELNIYHRNGSLVFSSTDSSKGWNGEHRNQPASAEVYYYIAKYTVTADEREIPEISTGDLNLLR